jgi:hypothetical protein
MESQKPTGTLSFLRSVIGACVLCACGVALYYLSETIGISTNTVWHSVIQQVASVFLATGILSIAWEFFAKRDFADEILEKAGISRELESSKLVQLTDEYLVAVNWNELFSATRSLDIFFAYGASWRISRRAELESFLAKDGSRLRVILPDPIAKKTIKELAGRFGYTPVKLKRYIKESTEFFLGLTPGRGSQVEVHYTKITPLASMYRFADFGVMTFYNHGKGRGSVPTFVFKRGGLLFSYLDKNFHSLVDDSARPTRLFKTHEGKR